VLFEKQLQLDYYFVGSDVFTHLNMNHCLFK